MIPTFIYTVLIIIALAFLYQYLDELQDRSVNSHWTLKDFYVKLLSLEFLNKDVSWRLKWKNRDPNEGPRFFGSTTFLVWLTDGEHLFQFLKQLTIASLVWFCWGHWLAALLFIIGVYAQGLSKRYTKLK